MRFLSTLLAVLVALWLTGNVQAGSILASIMTFLGWGLAVVGVILVIGFIWHEMPNPMKFWDDFKTGRFKVRP